jgi:hypothetical protein
MDGAGEHHAGAPDPGLCLWATPTRWKWDFDSRDGDGEHLRGVVRIPAVPTTKYIAAGSVASAAAEFGIMARAPQMANRTSRLLRSRAEEWKTPRLEESSGETQVFPQSSPTEFDRGQYL